MWAGCTAHMLTLEILLQIFFQIQISLYGGVIYYFLWYSTEKCAYVHLENTDLGIIGRIWIDSLRVRVPADIITHDLHCLRTQFPYLYTEQEDIIRSPGVPDDPSVRLTIQTRGGFIQTMSHSSTHTQKLVARCLGKSTKPFTSHGLNSASGCQNLLF